MTTPSLRDQVAERLLNLEADGLPVLPEPAEMGGEPLSWAIDWHKVADAALKVVAEHLTVAGWEWRGEFHRGADAPIQRKESAVPLYRLADALTKEGEA